MTLQELGITVRQWAAGTGGLVHVHLDVTDPPRWHEQVVAISFWAAQDKKTKQPNNQVWVVAEDRALLGVYTARSDHWDNRKVVKVLRRYLTENLQFPAAYTYFNPRRPLGHS